MRSPIGEGFRSLDALILTKGSAPATRVTSCRLPILSFGSTLGVMVAIERRRQEVGEAASAALPVLWQELHQRGWSHARLASELGEDAGKISKLLYGDRRPGRRLASKLMERLSISLSLWDEPLPKGWSPWKQAA